MLLGVVPGWSRRKRESNQTPGRALQTGRNVVDGSRVTRFGITRRLGRQRVPTITIRRQDCEIVPLGSHACDYVLTTRIVGISSIVYLVKTIGFYLASSNIFGLVRQTTSQDKYQQ